jgi:hypothetical protein
MPYPFTVLKMGTGKETQNMPVIDSLNRIITHAKAKLRNVGGIV